MALTWRPSLAARAMSSSTTPHRVRAHACARCPDAARSRVRAHGSRETCATRRVRVRCGVAGVTGVGRASVSHSVSSLSDSGESDEDASWVAWFCSLRGHDLFTEVDDAFIEDEFNLHGLLSLVPNYEYAKGARPPTPHPLTAQTSFSTWRLSTSSTRSRPRRSSARPSSSTGSSTRATSSRPSAPCRAPAPLTPQGPRPDA